MTAKITATPVVKPAPVAVKDDADTYTPTAEDRATVRGFILGL